MIPIQERAPAMLEASRSVAPKGDSPMPVQCTCVHCGALFARSPRDIKRGGGKYCSRSCQQQARVGTGSSRFQMSDGYVRVSAPHGHKAEHRIVVERHLGRDLRPNEQVHHINGVKHDNRIENLQVVSAKEHAAIHLVLADRWAKEHDCCVECGLSEFAHVAGGFCRRCHGRNYQWFRRRGIRWTPALSIDIAHRYLGESLSRSETMARLPELLELERNALLGATS